MQYKEKKVMGKPMEGQSRRLRRRLIFLYIRFIKDIRNSRSIIIIKKEIQYKVIIITSMNEIYYRFLYIYYYYKNE
jgi:hypothetical protein